MLKLTGGEFRGRMIRTPANENTRPTRARLRQALFNSLQAEVPDSRVLDLFAGSGALGFEALSRGASHVSFVENARAAVSLISQNAKDLKVDDRVTIIGDTVEKSWPRVTSHGAFDLVLADPPYAAEWEMKLLDSAPWAELLRPGGHFCMEWGKLKSHVDALPDETEFLVKVREKDYGDSVLTTYRRRS